MVNLVKLIVVYRFEQMWKFDGANPARLQEDPNAFDEGIDVCNLRENIVSENKVALNVFFGNALRRA